MQQLKKHLKFHFFYNFLYFVTISCACPRTSRHCFAFAGRRRDFCTRSRIVEMRTKHSSVSFLLALCFPSLKTTIQVVFTSSLLRFATHNFAYRYRSDSAEAQSSRASVARVQIFSNNIAKKSIPRGYASFLAEKERFELSRRLKSDLHP